MNLFRKAPEIVNVRNIIGEAGRLLEIAGTRHSHFHALGPQLDLLAKASPSVTPKSKGGRQVMLLPQRGAAA